VEQESEKFQVFGDHIVYAYGAKTLSDVQIAYNRYAQIKDFSKQFVLIADQSEGYTADGSELRGEEKATLMLLDAEHDGTAYGVMKAAAILVLFFDAMDDAPSFFRRIHGQNAFRYLPTISKVEWAVWMTAVRTALQTAASAA
jgi:hypothetical protein